MSELNAKFQEKSQIFFYISILVFGDLRHMCANVVLNLTDKNEPDKQQQKSCFNGQWVLLFEGYTQLC